MIQLKETQGDTLQGAIDGVNYTYVCSFDFIPETVNVYVNGRLKIRDWDDGFVVLPPRTINMKEPLLAGDSLEIEYRTQAQTGGGALGGVPNPPALGVLVPGTEAWQLQPGTTADVLQATATAEQPVPSVLAQGLRPAIIGSNEPGSSECNPSPGIGATVISEGLGGGD